MSLTVYVSSTQRDLIRERKKLKEWLEIAGYLPICMEVYPAFDEPPVERCREDVRSCDIYICLTGERYGEKPIGSSISFTEHEYLAAVESKKQILVFLKEVNSTDEELKLFKQRLLDRHGVLPAFTSEADLVNKVLASISHSLIRKNIISKKARTFFNENLKYLCDREPQSAELSSRKLQAQERAVVFSLEGFTKHLHRSFIERMKNEALKDIDGKNNQLMSVEINLKVDGCNTAASVSSRILILVLNELGNKGVTVSGKPTYSTLKKVLLTIPYKTVLITIFIQESSINNNVEKLKKYKEGIASFAQDALDLSVIKGHSLLFCICLEAKVKNELPKIVSGVRGIKRLPPLADISTGDVEHWLAHHKIETDFNKIESILKSIYKDRVGELPLAEIEKELEIIIQAYNT